MGFFNAVRIDHLLTITWAGGAREEGDLVFIRVSIHSPSFFA